MTPVREVPFKPDPIGDGIPEALLASKVGVQSSARTHAREGTEAARVHHLLDGTTGRTSCVDRGAIAPNPQSDAACLTMDQITLAVKPSPHTLPVLLTERNRIPLRRL